MARQSKGDAIPVLLTRPKPQSQAFAAALKARFGASVTPVIAPLMKPVFLTPTLPDGPFAAVIFTSATSVAAARGLDLPARAYCVGAKTATLARAAGFQAISADGDATALVAAVLKDPPAGKVLHLRGEDVRGQVAEQLISAGIETVSVILYRQDPQPLTAEALDLLAADRAVILPLFSPRSALLFRAALPDPMRSRLLVVAMSPAVAAATEGLAFFALELARQPDADAMLEAIARVLEKRPAP